VPHPGLHHTLTSDFVRCLNCKHTVGGTLEHSFCLVRLMECINLVSECYRISDAIPMMVFGMHHQLCGSTEDDMNKMSVIGHISLYLLSLCYYHNVNLDSGKSFSDKILDQYWVGKAPQFHPLQTGSHDMCIVHLKHIQGVLFSSPVVDRHVYPSLLWYHHNSSPRCW
jgi:hypothetical protein